MRVYQDISIDILNIKSTQLFILEVISLMQYIYSIQIALIGNDVDEKHQIYDYSLE